MMSENERQYELTGKANLPELPLDAVAQAIINRLGHLIEQDYDGRPTHDRYHALMGALLLANTMAHEAYDEERDEQSAEYHRWESIKRAISRAMTPLERDR